MIMSNVEYYRGAEEILTRIHGSNNNVECYKYRHPLYSLDNFCVIMVLVGVVADLCRLCYRRVSGSFDFENQSIITTEETLITWFPRDDDYHLDTLCDHHVTAITWRSSRGHHVASTGTSRGGQVASRGGHGDITRRSRGHNEAVTGTARDAHGDIMGRSSHVINDFKHIILCFIGYRIFQISVYA